MGGGGKLSSETLIHVVQYMTNPVLMVAMRMSLIRKRREQFFVLSSEFFLVFGQFAESFRRVRCLQQERLTYHFDERSLFPEVETKSSSKKKNPKLSFIMWLCV
jgi:hypothetical protein